MPGARLVKVTDSPYIPLAVRVLVFVMSYVVGAPFVEKSTVTGAAAAEVIWYHASRTIVAGIVVPCLFGVSETTVKVTPPHDADVAVQVPVQAAPILVHTNAPFALFVVHAVVAAFSQGFVGVVLHAFPPLFPAAVHVPVHAPCGMLQFSVLVLTVQRVCPMEVHVLAGV